MEIIANERGPHSRGLIIHGAENTIRQLGHGDYDMLFGHYRAAERLKKNCGSSAARNFAVLARLSERACRQRPVSERKRSQNPKEPLPPNGQNFFENASMTRDEAERIFALTPEIVLQAG